MKNSMIYIYIFVEKLRLNFRFKLNWVRSNEEFLKMKRLKIRVKLTRV